MIDQVRAEEKTRGAEGGQHDFSVSEASELLAGVVAWAPVLGSDFNPGSKN